MKINRDFENLSICNRTPDHFFVCTNVDEININRQANEARNFRFEYIFVEDSLRRVIFGDQVYIY